MRPLRTVLILAVVLGGLFVAADRVAVGLAEDKAAQRIRGSQGLTDDPTVKIKGFPFLTQVADKRLDEVDVKLDGLTAGASSGQGIELGDVSARLVDVRLGNNYSTATAAHATGTAHIPYKVLSQAAPEGLTVGYAGESDRVKIKGDFPGGVKGSAVSRISVVGGHTLRLRADEIKAPGSGNGLVGAVIRKAIDYDRPITGLPRWLTLKKVTATPDGVDVSVTGDQVQLATG